MKKISQYLIYATITVMFSISVSCDRGFDEANKGCKKFPEKGTISGLIINNAIVSTSYWGLYTPPKENMVITTDSLDLLVRFDNEATKSPIDFSKYSVLGKYASGDGCRVVYNRDVTKYLEIKKYIYKITVIECGNCLTGDQSMNWVLIPKIEDGFSVEIIVENMQWNNGRMKIREW